MRNSLANTPKMWYIKNENKLLELYLSLMEYRYESLWVPFSFGAICFHLNS